MKKTARIAAALLLSFSAITAGPQARTISEATVPTMTVTRTVTER